MAKFEQLAEFNYHELPLETKYRFAEIELNQFRKLLIQTIYQNEIEKQAKAMQTIFQTLFSYSERSTQTEDQLYEAFSSYQFRESPPFEKIPYFLYHHQTYNMIRKLTGASPNTIAKYRFQPLPFFTPVFKGWSADALARWNAVKHAYNLWNEDLAHYTKEI